MMECPAQILQGQQQEEKESKEFTDTVLFEVISSALYLYLQLVDPRHYTSIGTSRRMLCNVCCMLCNVCCSVWYICQLHDKVESD